MSLLKTDAIMKRIDDIVNKKAHDMLDNMLAILDYEGRVEKTDLSQVTGSVEKKGDNEYNIEFHLGALNEDENKLFKEIYYPNMLIKRKWD